MPLFALDSVLRIPNNWDAKSIQQFALSYSTVNLWIYFVIIPITWTLVLDRKLKSRYLITLAYCMLLGFAGILEYSRKIDLFQAGVDFCVYMQKVHHCSYAESCIIWCILMPLAVTIIFISLPERKKAPTPAFSKPT
jgi:hypothetical protein